MSMKRITKAELDVFLRKHELWLEDDPEGERADLSGANLSGANLSGANLSGANLSGADLSCADLSYANLSYANLYDADLSCANLSCAYLSCAYLSCAKLSCAKLFSANLSGADLSGANLGNAKNLNYPIICPEEGSFIGFKKVRNNYIVKLEIQADAMRSSATSRKCRCSKAKVISITNFDGTPANVEVVYSHYDRDFAYRVGETIEVNDFDPNRWNECAPGIHFFMTRTEAMNFVF